MNLIFFGTSAFGLPSLDSILASKHKLLSIVTSHDKPKGRHLLPAVSPVKEWALSHKIPLFEYAAINHPETLDRLSKINADVFVVIAFGVIFNAQFLRIPKIMSVNVHSSVLPRYRGAAPIHWAMMNGDSETGVSIVRVTEKLDAGDVLETSRTPIFPEDDIVSLEARLADLGAKALLRSLDLIEAGKVSFKPQDESISTYARKLEKQDGSIDWSQKAPSIHNRIRALKLWPVCSSTYKGKRILFLESRLAEGMKGTRPGTILKASRGEGIVVAAGEGAVEILKVQAEGRSVLPTADFLNGFPLKPGDHLE